MLGNTIMCGDGGFWEMVGSFKTASLATGVTTNISLAGFNSQASRVVVVPLVAGEQRWAYSTSTGAITGVTSTVTATGLSSEVFVYTQASTNTAPYIQFLSTGAIRNIACHNNHTAVVTAAVYGYKDMPRGLSI